MESQLNLWLEQAQITLQNAQDLATQSLHLLESMSQNLSMKLPDRLDFANYMVELLKWQQQSSRALFESLQSRMDKLVKSWSSMKTGQLDVAMKDLTSVLDQLQKSQVPSFLIEAEDSNAKTLYEFVAKDAIDLLLKNIKVYISNCEKCIELVNNQFKQTILEGNQATTKKYNRVMNQFKELLPMYSSSSSAPFQFTDQINTLLKENSSLEHELVNIIQLLTNHYDQCEQGSKMFKEGQQLDFEVLANDAEQLPDVLKELHSVCDIIDENQARSNKVLKSSLQSVESILDSVKEQLAYHREFKSYHAVRFLVVLSKTEEIFNQSSLEGNLSPIEGYTQTLNQLVYHYRQFIQVYRTKYLSELHHELYIYPRKFYKKLSTFLLGDLQKLQQEESDRRSKWLEANGDFIPKEFRLPGVHNQPVVTQVITDGLDDIDRLHKDGTFVEDESERKLIDLMMALKSGRA